MRDAGKPFFPSKFDNSRKFLSNLSAKKTSYQSNHVMKDYEFKKENLISILQQKAAASSKEFKVSTKGKFAECVAIDPGDHFRRDITWIKKANPIAAQ